MKKKIKSTSFRRRILKELKNVWEKNPDKRAYISFQEIWEPIWNKFQKKADKDIAQGVVNSLMQDSFIDVKVVKDSDQILIRITNNGLNYLSQFEKNRRICIIAVLGVVLGGLSLIIDIIQAIFD